MLVRDIKPPIREVISDVAERTVRYYRRIKLFTKTSKYAIPIAGILFVFIVTSIVIAIQDDERSASFYPVTVAPNGWDGANNVRIVELDETASIDEFNNFNSIYTNFSELVIESEEEPEEADESSLTEDILPSEEDDTDASTSTEESQAVEPVTSTEAIDDSSVSDDGTSTEPIILPPDEPPVDTEVSPPEEATTTEGPVTYFLEYLRSKFTTSAQEADLPEEPPDTTGVEATTTVDDTPADTDNNATGTEDVGDASSTPEDIFPTEFPKRPKSISVFTDRKEFTIIGFDALIDAKLYDENSVKSLRVNFSLAMEGKEREDDLLLLEYRFGDTESWNRLAVLTQDEPYSNAINGGYLSYEVQVASSTNIADVRNTEVRVSHFSNNDEKNRLSVLIDAVWFDVVYLDNVVTDAVFAELVSDNDTFRPDEVPELEFEYKDPEGIFGRFSNRIIRRNNQFKLKSHSIVQQGSMIIDAVDSTGTSVTYESEKSWTMRVPKIDSSIRPGKYTIELQMEQDGKVYKQNVEFFWGVLAINTNKSIYLPGEVVEFHMAALTDTGNTICDGSLRLTIATPDGKKVQPQVDRHRSCGPNNVTMNPDYSSAINLGREGTYEMRLESLDSEGNIIHYITDTFEVRESVLFDVERTGPTRIYPPADYTMKITIIANEKYSGAITETVPSSFKILGSNLNFRETTKGDTKTLKWDVDIEAGDTHKITYTFDAPDVSPELFLMGPLRIGEFEGARQWQIASDAPGVGDIGIWRDSAGSQIPTSTFADFSFATQERNDGAYTFNSSTTVQFDEAGNYLMIATFRFNNLTNDRVNYDARFAYGGDGDFVTAYGSGYSRNTANDESWVRTIGLLWNASVNDTSTVEIRRDNEAATGGSVANASHLQVVRLQDSGAVGLYTDTADASAYNSTTWTDVPFNNIVFENATSIIERQAGNTDIRLKQSNTTYLVGYGVAFGTGGLRTQRITRMVSGTDGIPNSFGYEYMREADNEYGDPNGLFLYRATSTNIDLSVQAQLGFADVGGSAVRRTNTSGMFVIELPSTAEVFISRDITALQDIGGTSGDFNIMRDVIYNDAGSFTKVDNTAVNIEQNMDLLAAAQIFARRSAVGGSRMTSGSRFELAAVDLAIGENGNYMRGDVGTEDTYDYVATPSGIITATSGNDLQVEWFDEGDNGALDETQSTANGFSALNLDTLEAAVSTTYEQSAWRWFANADSAQVGAALALQDASTTLTATGTEFRLRMLLHASTTPSGTSTEIFKLQFATSTPGGCDTSFSGETYIDVATSTGAIRYFDNSTPSDGDLLTATSSDPGHSAHATTTQTYEEENNFTVTSTIATGTDGLWDFSLDDAAATEGVTYCFRAVDSTGAILSTYSQIPEITTPTTPANLDQIHYRWRNDDGGETGDLDTGDGADGAFAPTGTFNLNTATTGVRTRADGIAYRIDASTATGTSLNRFSSADDFEGIVSGDEVMLINMQGVPSDVADVGNYELLEISSVTTTTLTFTTTISNSYDGATPADQKVVIQRVPNWTSVTLDTSGDKITASAWDELSTAPSGVAGRFTGLVVFRATGTLDIQANTDIDVSGLGFGGGTGGPTGNAATGDGGINGESYDGSGRTNAGDGGNDTISGANGGANGTKGGGSSSNSITVTAAADRGGGGGGGNTDGNLATDGAGGGGGGGYGSPGGGGGGGGDDDGGGGAGGAGGTATATVGGGGGGSAANGAIGGAGGAAGSGGSGDTPVGAAGTTTVSTGEGGSSGSGSAAFTGIGTGAGGGGGSYGTSTLDVIFLGSGGGGGGGHDNDVAGGAAGVDGGDGGGIVYIVADTITVAGNIISDGVNGVTANADAGASGGGSAGSIYLSATASNLTLGSNLVTALGGATGTPGVTTNNGGGGGGGGVGRIRIASDSPSGTTNPVASVTGTPSGGVGATFTLATNTKLIDLEKATTTRIRFEISNEGGSSSGGINYRLEVSAANPSACTSTTYTRIDSSTHWNMATSTFFADGDSTSNIDPGLPDENTTFVAGELKEDNDQTSTTTLTSTEFTEFEFAIAATASATDGASYCLRLTNAGATSTFTYSKYAEVSLVAVGVLTVDIVDSGGSPVVSPSIILGAIGFPIAFDTTTGTLGVSAEKIRVNNTTANPEWSLSVAASSTTAFWNATVDYDFNDPTAGAGDGGDADSLGGQMSVDALTAGVITPQGGCSSTGLTLGTATSFNEGVVDSITILSAGSTATTSCYWDLTTVDISQTIPGEQGVDSYNIDIILTVVAI